MLLSIFLDGNIVKVQNNICETRSHKMKYGDNLIKNKRYGDMKETT